MATDAGGARQRVVVVAVDASDNAKDAFDCTLIACVYAAGPAKLFGRGKIIAG